MRLGPPPADVVDLDVVLGLGRVPNDELIMTGTTTDDLVPINADCIETSGWHCDRLVSRHSIRVDVGVVVPGTGDAVELIAPCLILLEWPLRVEEVRKPCDFLWYLEY